MTAQRQALEAELLSGARQLNLQLTDPCVQDLLNYLGLLGKWNKVYNLTALRDARQMLTHHLLDCLATLHAFANANRVLDVGSGGGLPGVVIAIWAQHRALAMQIELVDTVQKKIAFLTQVKAELKLDNVVVHSGRVEEMLTGPVFDVITSRAFASLPDFISCSSQLLRRGGKIIAMKGPAFEPELLALPHHWRVETVEALQVPSMKDERYLITLTRTNDNHH